MELGSFFIEGHALLTDSAYSCSFTSCALNQSGMTMSMSISVAELGEGPGPLLFLDQTEIWDRAPLSQGLDDHLPPPPPAYLKVWIRHCI